MIKFIFGMSDGAQKHLIEIEKKLDRPSVLLKKASIYMERSVDKNFRAEGRPSKWEPLAPLTKALRRGKTFRILQDTGRLKGSISHKVFKNHAVVGTNVEYAQLMQEGGISTAQTITRGGRQFKIGSHKVRARPFLLFQREDVVAIEKMFAKHVSEAIK